MINNHFKHKILVYDNLAKKYGMRTNNRSLHCEKKHGSSSHLSIVAQSLLTFQRTHIGDWEHAHTIFFTSARAQCPRIITRFLREARDPRTIKAKDGTWLPWRRRCKGEDVLQVLATGKRCGTHVIDGSSLRVVHGEPDGTSSPPMYATSLFLSFPTLHVFLLHLRHLLLLRERLRIRCAARLSNQEILVTLSSCSLGNSTDTYISGKIDDAWRKREIIHNFCPRYLSTDIYTILIGNHDEDIKY